MAKDSYMLTEGRFPRVVTVVKRGGPGSGHHGHRGRPGEVGGSVPGDFHAAPGKRIVKVLSVVDTREYIEDRNDRWIPVVGSGTEHVCDRCGKFHEVHATVELEDGSQMVVGTSCAKQEFSEAARKQLGRKDNASKRLKVLIAEREAAEIKANAWDAALAKVMETPPPPYQVVPRHTNVLGPPRFDRADVIVGDVTVTVFARDGVPDPAQLQERLRLANKEYYRKRVGEAGFPTSRPIFDFAGNQKAIDRAKATLAEDLPPSEPDVVERGGEGSGHFGHEGREGEVGGSEPSPGGPKPEGEGKDKATYPKGAEPGKDDTPEEREGKLDRIRFAKIDDMPPRTQEVIKKLIEKYPFTLFETEVRAVATFSATHELIKEMLVKKGNSEVDAASKATEIMKLKQPELYAAAVGYIKQWNAELANYEKAMATAKEAGWTKFGWSRYTGAAWNEDTSEMAQELKEGFFGENIKQEEVKKSVVERGGPGSGHHGHAGRPGKVGGSQPGDFHSAPTRPDNRRFKLGSGVYKCEGCGKMTRETGIQESGIRLCAYCHEESGLYNSLSDGHITEQEYREEVARLQKRYNRDEQGNPLPEPEKKPTVKKPKLEQLPDVKGETYYFGYSSNPKHRKGIKAEEYGRPEGGRAFEKLPEWKNYRYPAEAIIRPSAKGGVNLSFAQGYDAWSGGYFETVPEAVAAGEAWLKAMRNDPTGTREKTMTGAWTTRGGPGSGHHGHAGRPGKVGGSLPGGGEQAAELSRFTAHLKEDPRGLGWQVKFRKNGETVGSGGYRDRQQAIADAIEWEQTGEIKPKPGDFHSAEFGKDHPILGDKPYISGGGFDWHIGDDQRVQAANSRENSIGSQIGRVVTITPSKRPEGFRVELGSGGSESAKKESREVYPTIEEAMEAGGRILNWETPLVPSRMALSKTNLGKVLQWSSSRYNAVKKDDAIADAHEILASGKGKRVFNTGSYTPATSMTGSDYLVNGEEGYVAVGSGGSWELGEEGVKDFVEEKRYYFTKPKAVSKSFIARFTRRLRNG